MKNDLILSHEMMVNYYSPELSELKIVNVFRSWDDIQKSTHIRKELIEKA